MVAYGPHSMEPMIAHGRAYGKTYGKASIQTTVIYHAVGFHAAFWWRISSVVNPTQLSYCSRMALNAAIIFLRISDAYIDPARC